MAAYSRVWLPAGAAAVALVPSGCGRDSGERPAAPKPSSPVIVRVDSRSITRAQFDHVRRAVLKSGRDGRPERRVRRQVVRFLITGLWLEEEARERG
ncbi:MAG TPA: hypothetical protein VHG90_15930, partial [Acidimicrobiales bacterium]|nr:hypothetical protein [Acidimicrobiales bacterium]